MMDEATPVICLDKEGKFVAEYKSMVKAASTLGCKASNIADVTYGVSWTIKGFQFVMKEYYNPMKNYSLSHRKKLRAQKRLKTS